MSDIVIVGGGLAGIFMALKLTRSDKWKDKTITLLEEQPTLGGRFFFASPRSFLGKDRPQIQEELFADAHENKSLSGFGFENYDLETKETLFRHLQNHLTEEENLRLEAYLANFYLPEQNKGQVQRSPFSFIKKEVTTVANLLNGSNEFLTKKEAEYLSTLIHGNLEEKSWTELSKSSKESLSQIIESVAGIKWTELPFQDMCHKLKNFFSKQGDKSFLPFQRKVALEIFLEKILLNRNIQIRNLCKLLRVEQKNKEFVLRVQDEIQPENNLLQTEHLILTIPLTKCAGILPKEIYSPEQSKFVSRIQPISMVVYELSHFSQIKSAEFNYDVQAYDKSIFPVERAHSFYTSDDRMLFYTQLDYEDSLQAPAVREAVSRLKRAAARVLNEDSLKEMKKGFRMPQNEFSDRVILLPVFESVPYYAKLNFELKQVKMGVPNLFCCGDSFFSLGEEPWKRVLHSVQDIASLLN